MSYCRWSSDDFHCDLYCYESDQGFMTHVAGNRVVGDIPKMPPLPASCKGKKWQAWIDAHRAQGAFLDTCERVAITLPHAGETFVDADLKEFKTRLLVLRMLGYCFPDHVIEQVDEEIREDAGIGV